MLCKVHVFELVEPYKSVLNFHGIIDVQKYNTNTYILYA